MLSRLILAVALSALQSAVVRADDLPETSALPRRLLDDPHAPVIGNPQGLDTVVEFFDYRCPYCRAMQPELRGLLAGDSEAQVILKEWPIFGGVSTYAARVALAADWQGKFRAVHEGLFDSHGPLDQTQVRHIAESAGVDLALLDRDMKTRAAELDRALAHVDVEAEELHLKGTPGLVIGRQVIFGALQLDDLKSLIAQARAEAVANEPPRASAVR